MLIVEYPQYDTYVSTQQSQRNIEKSLSSYASKLTTQSHALKQTDKRFSKIEVGFLTISVVKSWEFLKNKKISNISVKYKAFYKKL